MAKLIGKFQEPRLEDYELLIARNEEYLDQSLHTATDSFGWLVRTVKKDGSKPSWSTWRSVGEVTLKKLLVNHLGLTDADAEAFIEADHNDGMTVQQRITDTLAKQGIVRFCQTA